MPVQVFVESTDEKYISEVQISVGKTASDAEKALEGYEILKDDKGKNADLNSDASAAGLVVGAVISSVCMTVSGKKKRSADSL